MTMFFSAPVGIAPADARPFVRGSLLGQLPALTARIARIARIACPLNFALRLPFLWCSSFHRSSSVCPHCSQRWRPQLCPSPAVSVVLLLLSGTPLNFSAHVGLLGSLSSFASAAGSLDGWLESLSSFPSAPGSLDGCFSTQVWPYQSSHEDRLLRDDALLRPPLPLPFPPSGSGPQPAPPLAGHSQSFHSPDRPPSYSPLSLRADLLRVQEPDALRPGRECRRFWASPAYPSSSSAPALPALLRRLPTSSMLAAKVVMGVGGGAQSLSGVWLKRPASLCSFSKRTKLSGLVTTSTELQISTICCFVYLRNSCV
mmetsp:Transcript_63515/g.161162  ORF Transcript_63515/g.161162 Transcript_63515/m.161162 type:complete len:314 (+) Transcript_63515:2-943(+)